MRCPTCRKNAPFEGNNPYRPFCSERCKLIDLGKWATGTYRVPVSAADPEAGDSDLERIGQDDDPGTDNGDR